MAEPSIENKTGEKPSNKVIGAVTIGGLLFLLVAVASGIGAAIGFLGLVALVVGIVAVVRGGAAWARIVSRRAAVAVAVAGVAAMGVGGAMTPDPKTENTASAAAAPTSSATPTTAAPSSSAAPKPLVAAPLTTSAAPVLPPAPVMAITCPAAGTNASPVFGQQIVATGPYSVAITYGDGDQYANDDQHLDAIFSHTYKVAGMFTVQAVLTDALGQTTSASCSYSWTKPVAVAPSGGSSSGGSTSGGTSSGGATSGGSGFVDTGSAGGSASYANCDAVRAAGAAPIYAGQPGYSRKLDRDGDGVGCE